MPNWPATYFNPIPPPVNGLNDRQARCQLFFFCFGRNKKRRTTGGKNWTSMGCSDYSNLFLPHFRILGLFIQFNLCSPVPPKFRSSSNTAGLHSDFGVLEPKTAKDRGRLKSKSLLHPATQNTCKHQQNANNSA